MRTRHDWLPQRLCTVHASPALQENVSFNSIPWTNRPWDEPLLGFCAFVLLVVPPVSNHEYTQIVCSRLSTAFHGCWRHIHSQWCDNFVMISDFDELCEIVFLFYEFRSDSCIVIDTTPLRALLVEVMTKIHQQEFGPTYLWKKQSCEMRPVPTFCINQDSARTFWVKVGASRSMNHLDIQEGTCLLVRLSYVQFRNLVALVHFLGFQELACRVFWRCVAVLHLWKSC